MPGNEHPDMLGSFIIRPYAQSLTYVVSHIVDARILKCECPRADIAAYAASAKLSSAFNLSFAINVSQRIASPAARPLSKPLLPLLGDLLFVSPVMI